jgi:hypothetical protein
LKEFRIKGAINQGHILRRGGPMSQKRTDLFGAADPSAEPLTRHNLFGRARWQHCLLPSALGEAHRLLP